MMRLYLTQINLDYRKPSKVDSAMTAVSAGPGKSASQIYFYDWSDNYRF